MGRQCISLLVLFIASFCFLAGILSQNTHPEEGQKPEPISEQLNIEVSPPDKSTVPPPDTASHDSSNELNSTKQEQVSATDLRQNARPTEQIEGSNAPNNPSHSEIGTVPRPLVVELKPGFSWSKVLELCIPVLGALIAAWAAVHAVNIKLQTDARESWRSKAISALSSTEVLLLKEHSFLIDQQLSMLIDAHLLHTEPQDADDAVKRIELEEWQEEKERLREQFREAVNTLSEAAGTAPKQSDAQAVLEVRNLIINLENLYYLL